MSPQLPDFLQVRGPNGYHHLPELMTAEVTKAYCDWEGFADPAQALTAVLSAFDRDHPWFDDDPQALRDAVMDLTVHKVYEELDQGSGREPDPNVIRQWAYHIHQILSTPHWKRTGYSWGTDELGLLTARKTEENEPTN